MSKEPPPSANVDPVIAAMAAAVAYDHPSPEPHARAHPSAGPSKPRRTLHRIGAKKRNWCWNWFAQDEHDKNVAICDYCGRSVRRLKSDRGSPKKLLEHLHTHKITPEMENPARKQPTYTAGAESFYHSIQKRRRPRSTASDVATPAASASSPGRVAEDGRGGDENTATPASAATDHDPAATALFAFRTLRFLLENDVYLHVIFSPSWGELVARRAHPNIDAFLRQLEAQFDADGEDACMAALHRCADLHNSQQP
ncbi:LAFE_0B10902g1_1 [Lachancea fermentati]|uniref:LAFE_0B10902g1_1 n=1 Tax=Lachancea fermentati TaxID=4955 RepID=A0A1G4M8J8_LACFM|nr:LAFE_0B10902g1_1 [Lachancea fermentati]